MRVYKDSARGPRGAVGARRCPSPAGSGSLLPPSLRPRWEPVGRGRSSRTPRLCDKRSPRFNNLLLEACPEFSSGAGRFAFTLWLLEALRSPLSPTPLSPRLQARVSPGVSGC